MAVAQLGFKPRATAVLKSNLIFSMNWVRHGSNTMFETGFSQLTLGAPQSS